MTSTKLRIQERKMLKIQLLWTRSTMSTRGNTACMCTHTHSLLTTISNTRKNKGTRAMFIHVSIFICIRAFMYSLVKNWFADTNWKQKVYNVEIDFKAREIDQ